MTPGPASTSIRPRIAKSRVQRLPDGTWPAAALYVDPAGPYPGLTGWWFDAERDAKTYPGKWPVVAHPPCGPWGNFSWRCKNQDKSAGPHGVAMVRRYGGVLEHPKGSKLFPHCGIHVGDWDNPWRKTDAWGGYTILVNQWDWGHRAVKATVLYIVGTEELRPQPQRVVGDEPGSQKPYPVVNMGKSERRMSPRLFAMWLLDLASRCEVPTTHSPEAERTVSTSGTPAEETPADLIAFWGLQ